MMTPKLATQPVVEAKVFSLLWYKPVEIFLRVISFINLTALCSSWYKICLNEDFLGLFKIYSSSMTSGEMRVSDDYFSS